jgi:hypothetical protein
MQSGQECSDVNYYRLTRRLCQAAGGVCWCVSTQSRNVPIVTSIEMAPVSSSAPSSIFRSFGETYSVSSGSISPSFAGGWPPQPREVNCAGLEGFGLRCRWDQPDTSAWRLRASPMSRRRVLVRGSRTACGVPAGSSRTSISARRTTVI